jgi:hypothetical protein
MSYTFTPYSPRSITVDDIESIDLSSGANGTGAVKYYEEDGEVVTVISGHFAASCIMRPLLENLDQDMRPKENALPVGVGPYAKLV